MIAKTGGEGDNYLVVRNRDFRRLEGGDLALPASVL